MKTGFIVGGILFIIGLIMIGIGNILGGHGVFNLNAERVEKTYTFSGDYEEIIFSDNNSDVLIKTSPDENVHFKAYESEDEYYKITEGETLEINFYDDRQWTDEMMQINLDFDDYDNDYDAELYIPESMQPTLRVDNENGDITVENLVLNNLVIEERNGDVDVRNITTIEDFAVISNNGDIGVEEVKAKDFDLNNRNGDISIETVDTAFSIIENNNGDVEISNMYVNNNIKMVNRNGSVYFDNLVYEGTLEVETENGKIEGELSGNTDDYTFVLKTVNGDSYLNDNKVENGTYGKGAKVAYAKSRNGKIYLSTDEGGIPSKSANNDEIIIGDDDKVVFESEGIEIKSNDGSEVKLNSEGIAIKSEEGNEVKLAEDGITVKSAEDGVEIRLGEDGIDVKSE